MNPTTGLHGAGQASSGAVLFQPVGIRAQHSPLAHAYGSTLLGYARAVSKSEQLLSIPVDYIEPGNTGVGVTEGAVRLGAHSLLSASELGICHSPGPSICQETGSKAGGAQQKLPSSCDGI